MQKNQMRPGTNRKALPDSLLALAGETTVERGGNITQQYHPAEYIYYILSGSVDPNVA